MPYRFYYYDVYKDVKTEYTTNKGVFIIYSSQALHPFCVLQTAMHFVSFLTVHVFWNIDLL